MELRKSFKYRLYPNNAQERQLFQFMRTLKELHNAALEQRLTVLEHQARGWARNLNYLVQQNQLTPARSEVHTVYEHPETGEETKVYWLQDTPRDCEQLTLRQLDIAWQAWRANPKPTLTKEERRQRKQMRKLGLINTAKGAQYEDPDAVGRPRFKGRRSTITVCATSTIGVVDDKHIKFPKIGRIKAVIHRPVEGTIKQCSITYDVDQWYVSFSCLLEVEDPGRSDKPTVGIDRGVALTIADSTGRVATMPEEVRKIDDRVAHLQAVSLKHKDSKARRKSKNWHKAQDKIRKLKRKGRRIRDQWLHHEALYYARTYGTIKIENLKVKNMTASARGTTELPGKNVKAKSGLNKSILEQGWGRFVEYLKYKCRETGAVVIEVSAAKTSQTCAKCGHVDKESRKGRVFTCTGCGHTDDADLNAAKVIASRDGKVAGGYIQKPPKRPRRLLKRKKGTRTSTYKTNEEAAAAAP